MSNKIVDIGLQGYTYTINRTRELYIDWITARFTGVDNMQEAAGAFQLYIAKNNAVITQAADNQKAVFYFFIMLLIAAALVIIHYCAVRNRRGSVNSKGVGVISYRTIIQLMQEGFALFEIMYDQSGKPIDYYLIDSNEAAEVISGIERKAAVNKSVFDLLPDSAAELAKKLNEVTFTGESFKDEIYVKEWEKYLSISMYEAEKNLLAVMFSDITQKKLADEIMQKQKLSYEALFKNSSDAIIRFDQNHNIIDINEKFTELFGYTIDEIYGKEVDSVVAPKEKFDEAKVLTKNVLSGNVAAMEESVRLGSDGKLREVSVKGVAIVLNDKIIGGYGIYTDISRRKKAERELMYMNYHDPLTGLYNRRFFEEELKRLDTERNLPISIIMADVNGLKLFNDAFGHAEGDKLLVKAAEIIRKELREDEIVARLGGDELVILLPRTDSEEAHSIVKRIRASISNIRLKSIELSISFGWATKNSTDQDMNDILKNAEDYMYRNKLFESPNIREKRIKAIINSFYENNSEEEQHSKRVSSLCEATGAAMGMAGAALKELRTLGLLHDIGKIAIDNSILNKSDRLTKEEWNEIKRHPEIGYRILSSVNDMAELAGFILAHHERWDGKGYPKGIKGTDIPLQARITAVADAYDAMTSKRAYRDPLPESVAVDELEKNAGTQFDPEIVRVFINKVIN